MAMFEVLGGSAIEGRTNHGRNPSEFTVFTLNGEFFGTVSLLRFLEWYQLGTCFPSFTNLAAKAVLWWGGALHSTIHGGTELSILTNFVI